MVDTRLSDQIALAVKDQLRNVRFQIQSTARGKDSGSERLRSLLPRPVAVVADSVFSQMESTASALLSQPGRRSTEFIFPNPISAYLESDNGENRCFALEVYYGLKSLLRRFGSDVALISEQAVDEALNSVLSGYASAAKTVRDKSRHESERTAASIKLCAALSARLAAARPIREMSAGLEARSSPRHLLIAPNEYCACVIGLAIAIASKRGTGAADVDPIVDAADWAVDARFSELSAALKSRDPAAALEREFATMLDFLP